MKNEGLPQPLNTKSEAAENESREAASKTFTLVFRGDNPYMDSLASRLEGLGHIVTVHKIPVETGWGDLDSAVASLGNLEGSVLSDQTLLKSVEKVTQGKVTNAYELLEFKFEKKEDVVDRLQPTVDALRGADRIPVVLHRWLGDHMPRSRSLPQDMNDSAEFNILNTMYMYGEDQDAARKGSYYAAVLSDELGVPVITKEAFSTLPENFDELGVDPDKAVVLVDHHVYQMDKEVIAMKGFDKAEIVPICPCCIGNNAAYLGNLEKAGFKLHPMTYDQELDQGTAKLVAGN